MPIRMLSDETINKIAAGEVVEKPLNVVKELVENSIDAGASAITVDIKGGGIELIRVTDNGVGIKENECETAFLRHATSKISSIDDLNSLSSLGFRGEALSSISAVSKTEMITKTADALLGIRTVVEGGKLMEKSQVGAPNGTTIIVKSLFFNTPARKKFLKSATAEAAAIQDMVEKFALSNPDISIQLIINGKTKIATSGNGRLNDVIYNIFGKDVFNSLLEVDLSVPGISIKGFTAKPEFSYQARNGELYFVNGRYVKSKIIKTAIEEVYRNYLMQHRFPFCVLQIDVDADSIDVNVHPQKLEVKFSNNELISESVINALNAAFYKKDLIPTVSISENKIINYSDLFSREENKDTEVLDNESKSNEEIIVSENSIRENFSKEKIVSECIVKEDFFAEKSDKLAINSKDNRAPEPFETVRKEAYEYETAPSFVQESLFDKKLISDEALKEYKIIGQAFDTYWFMELGNELYIVDQHAAHEKVNYENFMKALSLDNEVCGQIISPPIAVHLSSIEEDVLLKNMTVFNKLGFEIDDFGMGSYAIRTIPLNLFGIEVEDVFHRLLNELIEKEGQFQPTFICEKLASMSCKAAIKGGQKITSAEMQNLMKQIMELDNPYNCPHGRPVFIRITKSEMEKKFKRIV